MSNIKIGTKIIAGFLLVAVIAAFIGIVGAVNLKSFDDADMSLYENYALGLEDTMEISSSFHRQRVNIRDMIRSNEQVKIEEYAKRVDGLTENIDKYLADLEKKKLSEEV